METEAEQLWDWYNTAELIGGAQAAQAGVRFLRVHRVPPPSAATATRSPHLSFWGGRRSQANSNPALWRAFQLVELVLSVAKSTCVRFFHLTEPQSWRWSLAVSQATVRLSSTSPPCNRSVPSLHLCLCHFLTLLYISFIHPFIIHSLHLWCSTSPTRFHKLLEKKPQKTKQEVVWKWSSVCN